MKIPKICIYFSSKYFASPNIYIYIYTNIIYIHSKISRFVTKSSVIYQLVANYWPHQKFLYNLEIILVMAQWTIAVIEKQVSVERIFIYRYQ